MTGKAADVSSKNIALVAVNTVGKSPGVILKISTFGATKYQQNRPNRHSDESVCWMIEVALKTDLLPLAAKKLLSPLIHVI